MLNRKQNYTCKEIQEAIDFFTSPIMLCESKLRQEYTIFQDESIPENKKRYYKIEIIDSTINYITGNKTSISFDGNSKNSLEGKYDVIYSAPNSFSKNQRFASTDTLCRKLVSIIKKARENTLWVSIPYVWKFKGEHLKTMSNYIKLKGITIKGDLFNFPSIRDAYLQKNWKELPKLFEKILFDIRRLSQSAEPGDGINFNEAISSIQEQIKDSLERES